MIKYMLQCPHLHVFEAWFSKGSDFDDQSKRGLLSCPTCADQNITKAPMAPHIRTSKSIQAKAGDQSQPSESGAGAVSIPSNIDTSNIDAMIKKCREHIANEFEDVGHDFTDKAKAMHYGEIEDRPIFGQTTDEQNQELLDEGIETQALPAALVPRKKKKLN